MGLQELQILACPYEKSYEEIVPNLETHGYQSSRYVCMHAHDENERKERYLSQISGVK